MNEKEYINTPITIEKELKAFFKRNDKILILDIGSCDGLDSIKYSNLFPNSQIYAFEPLENNLELIEINIKKFNKTNIAHIPYALSDKNGKAIFYLSSGKPENFEEKYEWNKSSSLLKPDKVFEFYPWLKFEREIVIETKTLKSFCEEKSIKNIDFIHMDVQGAELMVLRGAESILPDIKMIWLEVGNVEFYKNQSLKNDIENYLVGKGYTMIKDEVGPIEGDQLWVNYKFFLKKRITHNLWKCYSKIISKIRV